jgi:surface antigen
VIAVPREIAAAREASTRRVDRSIRHRRDRADARAAFSVFASGPDHCTPSIMSSHEMSESSNRLFVAFVLSTIALVGCSSAPDPAEIGTTSEGVCTQAYDWHDFPGGLQCVGGVDGFFQNHFGVGLPALCQYPTQNGCASCGACEFWEANAPNPAVWDRISGGTPQLFDMIVFPPTSGNAYGHVAVVDHVSGSSVYVMDDNYVAYQTKASCPHTVSWAPYGRYRLKKLEDKPPQGWLDSADCAQISGWAWDPDTASQAISVDVYFDGTSATGKGVHWTADVNRADLCTAIGSCNHGYVLPTPLGLMDNAPHTVSPYAIDSSGNGDNPLLQGAPKSFTCPPPAIPYSPAVKRHVTDPTVFGAWKFDSLTNVAHLSDATLTPLEQVADIPATPSLVTDDGSGGVFIVDGALLRHVQDPASMTAWRFDWNAIVKMPSSQFAAMKQGLPWPETPFLAQGSGSAVYMLDVTTPPAPPPPPQTGGDAGTAPPTASDGSGCAIVSSPTPKTSAIAWLALALALVARRRAALQRAARGIL